MIDSKHWAAAPAHNMWGKDPIKHKCMPAHDTTSCVHFLFLLMLVCHSNVTILVSQRGKPVQVLCPGGDYDVTVSQYDARSYDSSCFIHDTSAISDQQVLSQRQHLHGCSAGSTRAGVAAISTPSHFPVDRSHCSTALHSTAMDCLQPAPLGSTCTRFDKQQVGMVVVVGMFLLSEMSSASFCGFHVAGDFPRG
jgi:hypothetical protein